MVAMETMSEMDYVSLDIKLAEELSAEPRHP